MDSKSEQAEMNSKNERNLIGLADDIHREDQYSSSYTTPTVTATFREPLGMRPTFSDDLLIKHKREIERLHELLADRGEQGQRSRSQP